MRSIVEGFGQGSLDGRDRCRQRQLSQRNVGNQGEGCCLHLVHPSHTPSPLQALLSYVYERSCCFNLSQVCRSPGPWSLCWVGGSYIPGKPVYSLEKGPWATSQSVVRAFSWDSTISPWPGWPWAPTSFVWCFISFQLETSVKGLRSPSSNLPHPFQYPAYSSSLVFTYICFSNRPHGCCNHPDPKILYYTIRKEGDPGMFPGHVPLCDVLVSTRPKTEPEADPLFTQFLQHFQRGCHRRVQCLLKQEWAFSLDPEVGQHQPDLFVPLCQQSVHSDVQPVALCTNRAAIEWGILLPESSVLPGEKLAPPDALTRLLCNGMSAWGAPVRTSAVWPSVWTEVHHLIVCLCTCWCVSANSTLLGIFW